MNRWLRKGENWGPGAPRREYGDAHWAKPLKWNAQPFAECMQCGWRGEVRAAALQPAPAGFDRDPGQMRLCPRCIEPTLKEARRRVFPSVCDPFDNEVPPVWRAKFFDLIKATPNLDWLLLTKRIGNAWKMMADACGVSQASLTLPLHNVWLGATVVNQEEADRDIPKLLRVPARVRFLSMEPLLGHVIIPEVFMCPLYFDGKRCDYPDGAGLIDWVIAGGESGPNARPSHPDWFRTVREQCAATEVPFLFKQWGEWAEIDGDKPNRTVQVESDIGETLASRCDGFISISGEFVRSMDDATTDDPYRGLQRIGKKAAGRLLDGIEHKEFPKP